MSPSPTTYKTEFAAVHKLILHSQEKTAKQINQALIELYWSIGKYIAMKVNEDNWGSSTVKNLSIYLEAQQPTRKGFSARNIWRMKKFYETYQGIEKVSTLLTQITWSNHLHILSKTTTQDEQEFYLTMAARNKYSERDFARIIDSGTYERTQLANQKLSAVLTEFPNCTNNAFKDIYVFEFLDISEPHSELNLQQQLLKHLRKFLLEMGTGFSFIGQEYLVQVGGNDYRIDLLFHHREVKHSL